MTDQLDMFAPASARSRKERKQRFHKPPIQDAFDLFVSLNPHVLPEMLRLARARLAAGATRIGAKALWEELRESLRVQKLGEYRLNNSYTALAARRLIELEPALEGVIETRHRKVK